MSDNNLIKRPNPVVPRKNESGALKRGTPHRLKDLEFSDLYIAEASGRIQIRGAIDNDGPLMDVPDNAVSDLEDLRLSVMALGRKTDKREFFIDFDGVRYRVSKIISHGGIWFTLRKSKSEIPALKELGGFRPSVMRHLAQLGLQTFKAAKGGMILIAGSTGQGKTTTACSLLREYLVHFGDVAVTIEDPPEMMMDGEHGTSGRCFQLVLDEGDTFGSLLVSALRFTPKYIFLGELRKPSDASQALRAAISGHLVITTIHAGSIEEALNSLIKLASADEGGVVFARDQLASGIAGVIHQTLQTTSRGKSLRADTLFFGRDNGLRTMIRDGNINQLSTAIDLQRRRAEQNKPLFD